MISKKECVSYSHIWHRITQKWMWHKLKTKWLFCYWITSISCNMILNINSITINNNILNDYIKCDVYDILYTCIQLGIEQYFQIKKSHILEKRRKMVKRVSGVSFECLKNCWKIFKIKDVEKKISNKTIAILFIKEVLILRNFKR